MNTELVNFTINKNVSHIEVAFVNFDQWILTIGIRLYEINSQNVLGMNHVIFENVEGFRVLDEGAMLSFPWEKFSKSKSFVHRVNSGGWFEMEKKNGNMHLPDNAQEYIVITDNECVSVIAYKDPTLVTTG